MFRTQRRIEFRDTDAAGIAHFSVFFPMMEVAEHDLIRSLGLSVLSEATRDRENRGGDNPGPQVTWPRVAATCDYQSVARFEDLLNIDVTVLKLGSSSVQYGFRFTRSDESASSRGGSRPGPLDASADREISVATGTLTAVCCELLPQGVLQKTSIPESVRNLLAKHLSKQTFSADPA
ncbi:1,4-dihydroxy-2-naphthoyl-CoA hydrolase [Planctomycetes bacterium CA13]|uniref:1,4-dihydroxy-2-naphthoyl-CoA hydrolase n=1 Tax=Novipirellula herctigrandis TaxID=2527986 RepID=A0A5C5Z3R0_9BACT|nr:1,4-dihydroxy-2-naphthoyl-CoA hydrolase [Planctomycetes bacterium CA13]